MAVMVFMGARPPRRAILTQSAFRRAEKSVTPSWGSDLPNFRGATTQNQESSRIGGLFYDSFYHKAVRAIAGVAHFLHLKKTRSNRLGTVRSFGTGAAETFFLRG